LAKTVEERINTKSFETKIRSGRSALIVSLKRCRRIANNNVSPVAGQPRHYPWKERCRNRTYMGHLGTEAAKTPPMMSDCPSIRQDAGHSNVALARICGSNIALDATAVANELTSSAADSALLFENWSATHPVPERSPVQIAGSALMPACSSRSGQRRLPA
jgi:hypothetical protein